MLSVLGLPVFRVRAGPAVCGTVPKSQSIVVSNQTSFDGPSFLSSADFVFFSFSEPKPKCCFSLYLPMSHTRSPSTRAIYVASKMNISIY